MTTLSKGKRGWTAEDLIEFDGPRKLRIETYKYDGSLITRAAVNTYTATGYSHAFGVVNGTGDYSERLIVRSTRCTEKTIAEQHAIAMQRLPEIMAKARAHYADQRAAQREAQS